MSKISLIVGFTFIYSILYAYCGEINISNNEKSGMKSNRNKRLLFFDEEGNLVKTFTNPYLRDRLVQNPATYPFYGNFFKPFQSFLQLPNAPTSYMIPISEDVIQNVNQDPVYQNKVFFSTNEMNVEANPLCAGKRSQLPSPKSCSSFLNCWDGWAFEQDCPEGLFFSSEGFCDYAHRVDCGNRRLSDDSSTPQCGKEFEAFRNEARCSEFFVCVNRLPIRFKCPADLYFNQALGVCDYPYRVECNASLGVSKPIDAPPTNKESDEQSPSNSPSGEIAASQRPTKMLIFGKSASSFPVAMSKDDAVRQLMLSHFKA